MKIFSQLSLACLCLVQPAYAQTTFDPATYPTADAFLGEVLGETEVQDASDLAADLYAKVKNDYVNGGARRDAHPKAHGCVAAKFSVNADIPPELQHGVFQPNSQYDALIRFSNGSPNAASDDHNGDTRGMAIKLFGVVGEKIFADPDAPDAQDFILISSPYFFVNDSHGYTEFFRIVNAGGGWATAKIPFILGLQGSINAYRMLSQVIGNPLFVKYYSVTPYQLGLGEDRQAVKYSARPCVEDASAVPDTLDQNFLRHAMQDSLNEGTACMEFLVQTRSSADFDIEDVVTTWDEVEAPFVSIAKIEIAKQVFDTASQNAACEARSYNPWHSIAEHKPLGTINRMRRVVYQVISELRFEMNGK